MGKPAIVFLEMVGQIIPCKTHGIICPTLSQKGRTGYALPKKTENCSDFFFGNFSIDPSQISYETPLTNNLFLKKQLFSCSKNDNPKNAKLCQNKYIQSCFFLL